MIPPGASDAIKQNMSKVAWKILTALERSGDMPLEGIAALIPRKWKDHRDFYALASLVTQGYIEAPFLPQGNQPRESERNAQLLSWKYFAISTGDKKASYKNHAWSIHGEEETLKGQRFALTGAGRLYLEEARNRRFDRVFTLASGIGIGVLVALSTVLIEKYLL